MKGYITCTDVHSLIMYLCTHIFKPGKYSTCSLSPLYMLKQIYVHKLLSHCGYIGNWYLKKPSERQVAKMNDCPLPLEAVARSNRFTRIFVEVANFYQVPTLRKHTNNIKIKKKIRVWAPRSEKTRVTVTHNISNGCC